MQGLARHVGEGFATIAFVVSGCALVYALFLQATARFDVTSQKTLFEIAAGSPNYPDWAQSEEGRRVLARLRTTRLVFLGAAALGIATEIALYNLM